MTKTVSTSLNLILILVLALSAVAQLNPNKRGDRVLQQGGTLHDAALAAGGAFSASYWHNSGWTTFSDLKGIVKASNIIVIGNALDNVGRLSKDQRDIQSVYTIRIERVMKGGHLRPGENINIITPGGRVSFPDGTMATLRYSNFPRMLNGGRYLLFLLRSENGEYYPTGSQNGIFELKSDDTVIPFARAKVDPLSKFRGISHAVLEAKVDDEIRSTAEEQRQDPQ